jgi:hypothetical protein
LKKITRGEKSGGTVPLMYNTNAAQVLAYTAAGDGKFSSPVSCSTQEDGKLFHSGIW